MFNEMPNTVRLSTIMFLGPIHDSIAFQKGVTALCEHDNEPSGSIKGGGCLEQPRDCQLLNNSFHAVS
jgi:hypothetical protein